MEFFNNGAKVKHVGNKPESALEIRIILVYSFQLSVFFTQFLDFLLFKFGSELIAVFCLADHSGNGVKIIP